MKLEVAVELKDRSNSPELVSYVKNADAVRGEFVVGPETNILVLPGLATVTPPPPPPGAQDADTAKEADVAKDADVEKDDDIAKDALVAHDEVPNNEPVRDPVKDPVIPLVTIKEPVITLLSKANSPFLATNSFIYVVF